MSFSENYLNKILNSAIKYHNFKNNEMNPLPNILDDKYTAIDLFKKSLEYEAYQNFKQPNDKNTDPILCAVNLNTDEPGIIISKNNDKLCIHTKYAVKEEKKKKKKKISKEDLEILSDKTYQKLKKHKDLLEKKYLEKKAKKDEEIHIKTLKNSTRIQKKELKDMEKECQKMEKIRVKKTKKLEKLNGNPQKNQSKIVELKEEIIQSENKIQNFNGDINQKNEIIKKNTEEIKLFNIKKQEQKEIRKKKIEENKLKKLNLEIEKNKKKLDSQDIKNEENSGNEENSDSQDIKNEENSKKTPLNKIKYSEMFDELHELFQKPDPNKIYDTYNKEIDQNMVKIYPSPIPFERHIDAFSKCDPNPILLPSLLYGDSKYGSEFIKIFHGPPGTGKTWRLMKELKEILNISPRKKILICAPSNIGVINLYNRALTFGIHGCLILSAKHYPDNFEMPKKQGKNNIVFSTISMRHGRILNGIEFKTIIIDEAAQCQESWFWGLLRNRVY